ncbi:CU044_2847 family protein [Streptomyces sp. NPDC020298]|uniref:CU044_2847 family protein n=1 Tax=unclassified Streptomyces TaxID=2593676 RepID=UPI0033EDF03C
MGREVTRVARIELPDGTPVWARISGAEELAVPSGELSYTDTGFAERVEASVESLHSLVTGVAGSLAGPLRAVRPDEVSVEFGIELTAKAGKVVGLLADGEAKAGITVTLTWNGGGPPDPAAPGTAPAPASRTEDRAEDPDDPGATTPPAAPRAPRDGSPPGGGGATRADASTGAPGHGGAPDARGGGGA